ncbi:P-type conjugative transfer protein TrbJ [Acidocella sp.]|uniref:P-type conjugative transfer protein TrbJ n=1 Tax=Acidocella sp. TaxID=50710 RepID=UPI002620C793|nr:P-type conjugative transfer protein TrbJ [Acidocella sp.]
MSIHKCRVALTAATIMIAAPIAIPHYASAQVAVIDAANLTQNILTATRELQQIDNQIQSLQNEATMLENQAKNLTSLNYSSLDGITNDLQQISDLMNQAQGISFDVQSVEAAFQQAYPQQYAAGTSFPQLLTDAQTRWQNARDAFQQTMTVQSQIAQTVQTDTGKLATLVDASQGAVGSLQAQQATNQLLALSIKQQLQVQTLMAAQGRAEALKDADSAEAEAEGSAAFTTFLGSSNAYTP